jgi:prophage tail gpP-like protein
MRVVINGDDVAVGWVEVVIDADKITRSFTIANTESQQSIFTGDDVEIYNNNGLLLIEAEVEYNGIEQEKKFIYAGRNRAKYIVDCDSDKTIQFSEKQTVQSVLTEIAGKFGLTVKGIAKMPEESAKTILIGDNLGKVFIEIAKESGQIITSDAEGNIIIEGEPEKGNIEFIYGQNIRSRIFKIDTTKEYDRYLVISQSSYKKTQDANIKGEYGKGDFVKVIRSKESLTIKECEELAKKQYQKDRRRSLEYTVEADNNLDIDVNQVCKVTDLTAGIDTGLKIKKIIATMDDKTDKIVITFDRGMI